MFADDADSAAADRDRLRYELATPLTVITARAELLHRHLLRANGLPGLERDQMLGNVAAVLTELQLLRAQLETVIGPEAARPDAPPSPATPCRSPEEPS